MESNKGRPSVSDGLPQVFFFNSTWPHSKNKNPPEKDVITPCVFSRAFQSDKVKADGVFTVSNQKIKLCTEL